MRNTALQRKLGWLALACPAACTVPNPAYRPEPAEGASAGLDAAGTGADATAPPLDAAPPTDGGAPDLAVPADAPMIRPTGLVAHWRLDEAAGTAAVDDTGANPGVLHNGAGRVAGGFPAARFANPGAASFDGVDDYIELGVSTLPAMQAAKSVSLWCRPAIMLTAGRRNLFVFNNRGAAESLQLGLERGYPAVWLWGPDPAPLIADARLDTGWHHLVYAYDGAVQRLFVDGAPAGTLAAPPPTAAVARAHLGTYDPIDDRTELWSGLIDDVRVYDRGLSEPEIAWLAAGLD